MLLLYELSIPKLVFKYSSFNNFFNIIIPSKLFCSLLNSLFNSNESFNNILFINSFSIR